MQVNMHEAKSRLSELGERALKGEKIVIAKAGKPLLDLVPHQAATQARRPGVLKDKAKIIDEHWDQPDQNIIDAFEGSDL